MNALNKLIRERFADITQGASADVYPLTKEELKFIEFCASGAAQIGAAIGTDQIDNLICQLLENRKPTAKDATLQIQNLIAHLPLRERINIGHNILLDADAFGVNFWDRSDIDNAFENWKFDNDVSGVVELMEHEYSQIVVNCRESYRKTDEVDIEAEIEKVISQRKDI